jgi:hypothetical protein
MRNGALKYYLDSVLYRIRGCVWPATGRGPLFIVNLQLGAQFRDLSIMVDPRGSAQLLRRQGQPLLKMA